MDNLMNGEKVDTYGNRVIKHYKIQNEVNLELLSLVQKLCPKSWVIQVLPNWNEKKLKAFLVTVTNGDDNVTAVHENLGAALALLIHYLLDGSVFPLTRGDGKHLFPGDIGWSREKIDSTNDDAAGRG